MVAAKTAKSPLRQFWQFHSWRAWAKFPSVPYRHRLRIDHVHRFDPPPGRLLPLLQVSQLHQQPKPFRHTLLIGQAGPPRRHTSRLPNPSRSRSPFLTRSGIRRAVSTSPDWATP